LNFGSIYRSAPMTCTGDAGGVRSQAFVASALQPASATFGLHRNELLPALLPFNMLFKSARLPSFCGFLQSLAPSSDKVTRPVAALPTYTRDWALLDIPVWQSAFWSKRVTMDRTALRRIFLALFLALILAPHAASAHIVAGEAMGFWSGFNHPVSGLDHILAMIAVGMWGVQLGRPATWVLPITFPLIMACGGFLGLAGIPLPGAEIGIAFSGIVLGTAVLTAFRAPLALTALIVGTFGLFHGHAHGVEMPPGQNPLLYSLGFVLATGLMHATGIAIGLLHRRQWGHYAIRFAGVVVLAGGLFFLWHAAGA